MELLSPPSSSIFVSRSFILLLNLPSTLVAYFLELNFPTLRPNLGEGSYEAEMQVLSVVSTSIELQSFLQE